MTDNSSAKRPPPEVIEFYTQFAEESRLGAGSSQLEFERTRELLERFLPPPPSRIVDIGGAAGAYAFWLAERGYQVDLVDATLRLVDEARRRNLTAPNKLASLDVADARVLSQADASADAALLMGPLYHLTTREDRLMALREALRVLREGGILVAAAISRYAGTLDGLALHPTLDTEVVHMRHAAIADGQYRNTTGNPRYFVTAYFHRPEDLAEEMAEVGYRDVRVFGVEGPGWLLPDFEARWHDERSRRQLLTVAQLLEEEESIVGVSAHLFAVGSKGTADYCTSSATSQSSSSS
jgi:ubiquinone/menaquinone biosynthesis C-methylase UbiE